MSHGNQARAAVYRELRRSQRVEIGGRVTGHLVALGAPIKIRDLGFGGFSVETSFPLRAGARLEFRFESTEGSLFVFCARVAHSRRVSGPAGLCYVTGLEFADKTTRKGRQTIDLLIEKVVSVLSLPSTQTAGRADNSSEP